MSSCRRNVCSAMLLALCASQVALAAKARNIIIFVSDGGGYNAFLAASLYQHGRPGAQPYDQPAWVKYACRTSPLSYYYSSARNGDSNDYDPATAWDGQLEIPYTSTRFSTIRFKGYSALQQGLTDSAAAGTSLATGYKAHTGRINYADGPTYSSPAVHLQSIAELAKAAGLRTGVVTSVEWTDATPATLGGAHNSWRSSHREIANEMLSSGTLDLIMGASHPEYDRSGAPRQPTEEKAYDIVGGWSTWQQLCSGSHPRGWKLIQTKADFQSLCSGPTPGRLLGIPRVLLTLQQQRQSRDWNRDGIVDAADIRAAPAFGDPPNDTVPTLAAMTRGALNVLGHGESGFYLMVEGGAVDWAAIARQPGRLVEEQIDLNNSIQAAIDWVYSHSSWDETLVIITADHETGLVWGVNSDTIPFEPLNNHGCGKTPATWFNAKGHSTSLVPLYARGPAAGLFALRVVGTDPVRGKYVDNTSVFEIMKATLTGQTLPPTPPSLPQSLSTESRSPYDSPSTRPTEESYQDGVADPDLEDEGV